jgi:hypothetical protein
MDKVKNEYPKEYSENSFWIKVKKLSKMRARNSRIRQAKKLKTGLRINQCSALDTLTTNNYSTNSFPVSFVYASIYRSLVFVIISSGNAGGGGLLSQSRVRR